ncbi:unnamed protein product [Ectocarpus sp. 6 AP-2014]
MHRRAVPSALTAAVCCSLLAAVVAFSTHSPAPAIRPRITSDISQAGGGVPWKRQQRRACGGVRVMMSSGGDEEETDEEAEARAEREFDSIFDKNSAILDVPLETFDESRVEPLMPGSTKTELPVFMLDMSACPGGVVPLHIFEMRYRQMFNDIGTTDNRFGMLVTDAKTGRPCKYGAVMECAQRKLLPDGRQYVLNQAVERFRVLKVLKTNPYTVMEVEVGIPDNKPLEGEPVKWGAEEGTRLEDLELEVYDTVNSVVDLMNKLAPPATPGENRTLSEWFLRYSPKVKRDEGLDGESAGDDLAKQAKEDERRMKFSYAVAEMIAMESRTKQLLLQSRSTAYRLMAVREILVKAQKELAAKSSLKDTLG